jgi:hypothetical protein
MVCAQLSGYSIQAFWLCLGGVLLIYNHRLLLTVVITLFVYTGLDCGFGGPAYYVIVVGYGTGVYII